MNTFKITEAYGNHCNECGKAIPGKVSNTLLFDNSMFTLCEDCFKLFIGTLYLAKSQVFEELISTLSKNDRAKILSLINS